MSVKTLVLGSAVAVLVGAGTLASAPAHAGCRGFVQGHAEGTFKYPTELLSRVRWRGEVKDRYDSGYMFWSKAEEKTTTCYKAEPGGKWLCTSRARPCN